MNPSRIADDVLIRAEGVSKSFCRSLRKSLYYGTQDILSDLSGLSCDKLKLRDGEFWAVNNVSFELRRGECLGLIGHNGAGKTTLLKMLNGIIKPDCGRIELRGRVNALIALGAGFNPILTGRENIYVNGALLGLSRKEIDSKIDGIIDFAEIGDFIDSPVQNYSSGMAVRLGFAIASALEPDVLLLDEVLAVGDIGFSVKCLNLMRKLSRKTAIVFVSHNMQFITSFCTRAILLENGRIIVEGKDTMAAVSEYFRLIKNENKVSLKGAIRLNSIALRCHENGVPSMEQTESVFPHGTEVILDADLEVFEHEIELFVYFNSASNSQVVCFPVQNQRGQMMCLRKGRYEIDISLGPIELNAGPYSLLVVARDKTTHEMLYRAEGLSPFTVTASRVHWGAIVRPSLATVRKYDADLIGQSGQSQLTVS